MVDAIKTLISVTLSQLGNTCIDFMSEVSPLILRLFRDLIDLVKVFRKLKSHVFSFDEIGEILQRSNGDLSEMIQLSSRMKDDHQEVLKDYEKQLKELQEHPLNETTKEKLLNKGESFVKKISAYDEYKKLNQMLSMLKSIHNKDYEDVNQISDSLYALLMCLKEGDISSLSHSLALINNIYTKHKSALETYQNWYMKH